VLLRHPWSLQLVQKVDTAQCQPLSQDWVPSSCVHLAPLSGSITLGKKSLFKFTTSVAFVNHTHQTTTLNSLGGTGSELDHSGSPWGWCWSGESIAAPAGLGKRVCGWGVAEPGSLLLTAVCQNSGRASWASGNWWCQSPASAPLNTAAGSALPSPPSRRSRAGSLHLLNSP
jgi:hypothetical protein